MKVLHVLNTNSYSGAENVAITIINHMSNVESIYLSLNGPISEILKKITFSIMLLINYR